MELDYVCLGYTVAVNEGVFCQSALLSLGTVLSFFS